MAVTAVRSKKIVKKRSKKFVRFTSERFLRLGSSWYYFQLINKFYI